MTSKIFAVAAAVLLSTPALADVREEERFSYTLESGGRLSLENVNGSISITGGSADQVEIVAHKKAGEQEAAEQRHDDACDHELECGEHREPPLVDARQPGPADWFHPPASVPP